MDIINIPEADLESNVFSVHSIEGILLIIAIFFIIKYATKKAVDIAIKLSGIILLFQILYLIGCSPIDEYLKLSTIFKYDVFSTIARVFPGTFLCKILTTFGYYLSQFTADIINWIVSIPFNLFKI